MDLEKLFHIYSDLLKVDSWPTVRVDPGRAKTTLEYSRLSAKLPEDYRKFISSGILEVACGWQLFGVTLDSMSLDEANSSKIWREDLPDRYTLFGTAGGEDCWYFFDHEPEGGAAGPVVVFEQWPDDDFPTNKLMYCADSFSSLLFDEMIHSIEKSSEDLSRKIKKLSGQLDLLNETGHAATSNEDMAATVRSFSRVLRGGGRVAPCHFLSAHRLQRYAGNETPIPLSYRVMEYVLTQPESASNHVQFVESFGGHITKLIARRRRQSPVIETAPGPNLLIFGAINDADYLAFDMKNAQTPEAWPVYLIKIADGKQAEQPILLARSHYESIMKIIISQLQAKQHSYQSLEDRLALL